ncbi:methyltransferase family protein [Saccharopolyspora erythraea NRRL 2338]|uniref:Methyltransferase n=1 Tax=Saccharopolyspora erythraea (strain ATCC 11635 / DSM 40517 / JCM 4748 / NBRC 13426 / NCIMB 8594 / NRRL 2338) TaxID=405948 RepID=A4FR20_SACEN|nr:class I SAM-dependent methyltransferase [Saccharopolyspora erythraea]EQD83921.1 methyltransferase [Saccharopolyspora erythraea D]PFG93097.1 methyltransferase family protein [Saccharopolyspora erythraea NRRL 2338]QRK89967.1 class I SAM-dependent methyltransferase [Saccharopolyspora erythraea]CAM06495.1 methyltransferase [Saccharopolyspora erythraea NRRL 2338]
MTEPSHLTITRAAYDAIAVDYAQHFRAEPSNAFGRAMLGAFAELVRGSGPVADLGCGPGNVTAHLHSLGLDVFGVDLSPKTVENARRLHPDLRFDVGSMTELALADGALGGIVAWYSVIHTPQELLPELFAEFHRLLAPGGHVLLAFQVGDQPLHLAEAWGHRIGLDFRRLSPDHITELLEQAGFAVAARLVREPDPAEAPAEPVPQAHLLARRS